jgi:hypothetical protein
LVFIVLDFAQFEEVQHLRFLVLDVDNEQKARLPSQNGQVTGVDIIGEVHCSVSDIVTAIGRKNWTITNAKHPQRKNGTLSFQSSEAGGIHERLRQS